jgi:hypothetical protein
LPPLNLFDAIAAILSDCFTNTPDYEGYQARKEDVRIFDPAARAGPAAEREGGRSGDGEIGGRAGGGC